MFRLFSLLQSQLYLVLIKKKKLKDVYFNDSLNHYLLISMVFLQSIQLFSYYQLNILLENGVSQPLTAIGMIFIYSIVFYLIFNYGIKQITSATNQPNNTRKYIRIINNIKQWIPIKLTLSINITTILILKNTLLITTQNHTSILFILISLFLSILYIIFSVSNFILYYYIIVEK